jgi:hypothetical protein
MAVQYSKPLLPAISGSVTTAWRVLRLRMEERDPLWMVAANILNERSWTAENGKS